MHFPACISFLLLASLSSIASAAPQRGSPGQGASPGQPSYGPGQWQPDSASRCYTRIDSTAAPRPWQTSWTTSYPACTSTLTSTATIISTPSTITSTVTATTTSTLTASTVTSTATVSTTLTSSVTTTTTTTNTATATSTTTTTAASTVPTPSGFIAIQTSLPGSGYTGANGGSPVSKRDNTVAAVENKRTTSKKQFPPGHIPAGKSYPQAVVCASYTQTKCSTTVTTLTTTATATSTPTTTVTTTSTVVTTVTPSASTTVTNTATSTTTITASATTTTTITTTTTATSYTTTVYAACATNNFADYYVPNSYFDTFTGDSAASYDTLSNIGTAYDCCVAAFIDPNGAAEVWGYLPGFGCYVAYVSSATCAANAQTHLGTAAYVDDTSSGGGNGGGYTLGNACIGQFTPASARNDT